MERLRLEWEQVDGAQPTWLARAGDLALNAWTRDGYWHWNVNAREPGYPDEEGSILRVGLDTGSLLAAQLAAEAAALDLLTSAVAAFGVEAPDGDITINYERPSGRWCTGGPPDRFASERPVDATRLACALLAAARKVAP